MDVLLTIIGTVLVVGFMVFSIYASFAVPAYGTGAPLKRIRVASWFMLIVIILQYIAVAAALVLGVN